MTAFAAAPSLSFPGASPALVLLAAAALVVVVALERRLPASRGRRVARTLARGAAVLAVAAALADPRLEREMPSPARVVLVVDARAAASAGEGARAALEREAAEGARAAGAALAVHAAGDAPGAIAAALASAALSVPEGERGAVVVASDGRADATGVPEAVAALVRAGVAVRGVVVPPPSPPAEAASVEASALAVPREVRGPFAVRAVVRAPPGGVARLLVDGVEVAARDLPDAARGVEVEFDPVRAAEGAHEVALRVEGPAGGSAGTASALVRATVVVARAPRVRGVAGASAAGRLGRALAGQGLDARIDARAPGAPAALPRDGEADVVVLDADAAAALPRAEAEALAEAVRKGTGLLLLAGDDAAAWASLARGPLAAVLPVVPRAPPPPPPPEPPEEEPPPEEPPAPEPPAPPPEKPPPGPGASAERRPEEALPISLLLVIDRSYSMTEEGKLGMAVVAAEEAAASLSPSDRVAVLTFADTPTLDAPFRPAGDTRNGLVGRLEPGGNTDIYSALVEAERVMRAETSPIRHVVLLTDGKQTGVAYFGDLVDRMARANITLTAVALGYRSDDRLLKRLANQGGGRYLFAATARDIPRVLTRDTTTVVDARRERAGGKPPPPVADALPRPDTAPEPAPPRPSPPRADKPPRAPRPPRPRPAPPPPPAAVALVRVRPHEALAGVDPARLPRVGPPRPADPAPLASVLLAREDGAPALVAARPGLGRSIAWTPPPDDAGVAGWAEAGRLLVQSVRALLPAVALDAGPAARVESRPSGDVLFVALPDSADAAAEAARLSVERRASDGARPAAFLGVEDGEAAFALPPPPAEGETARALVSRAPAPGTAGPARAAPEELPPVSYLPRPRVPRPAGSDPEALARALGAPLLPRGDPGLFTVPARTRTEGRAVFAWFAALALALLPLDAALHRRSRAPDAAPARAPAG